MESALKKFLKAEEIGEDNYLVLNIIGLIYLNSTKFLDVVKAENYLIRAAKYADSQISPEAIRGTNILSQNVNDDFSEIVVDDSVPKRISSDSYYNVSIACYIQMNFNGAVENAKKAYEINGDLDAGYSYAKFLLVSGGDANVAADALVKIMLADRMYLILCMQDVTFINNKIINSRLTKLKEQIHDELKNKIEFINANILEDSYALPKKNELETNFQQANNLLSLLELKHNSEKFVFEELSHDSKSSEGVLVSDSYGNIKDFEYTIKDVVLKERKTIIEINNKVEYLKSKVLPDSEAFEFLNSINTNIKTVKEIRTVSTILTEPQKWRLFSIMNKLVVQDIDDSAREKFYKRIAKILSPIVKKRNKETYSEFDIFHYNHEFEIDEPIDEYKPILSLAEFVEIENKLRIELNNLQSIKTKLEEKKIEKEAIEDTELKKNGHILTIILCVIFPRFIYLVIYQKYKKWQEKKSNIILEELKEFEVENQQANSNEQTITQNKQHKFVDILKLVFFTFLIWLGSYIVVAVISSQLIGETWKNVAGMFGAITLLLSIGFIIIRTIFILNKKKVNLKLNNMETIPKCPTCGNNKKGDSAKRCSKCGKITCIKCSFSGCTCGSSSSNKQYKIG